MFELQIEHTDGQARCGRFVTAHGSFQTPAFMPVGSRATVRGVTPEQLRSTGTQIVLANTYHLILRPGAAVVEAVGGLHRFMGWDGPILTDSGGYQVFSLAPLRKIADEGVTFNSHIDGRRLHLGPVEAIRAQEQLGADIVMVLDECVGYPCSFEQASEAVRRTLLWAGRCKQAHHRRDQALFGIVQGSVYETLRTRCADALSEMDFDGYAIGGLSVGEGSDEMLRMLEVTVPLLRSDKPRYLMGVGYPSDILRAVAAGVDMFDCVLPTRNGRNANAFSFAGRLRLRNEQYATDRTPIDPDCRCPTCRRFSRAYLRHLFLVGEMLGPTLVSVHNIYFFQELMRRTRQAIAAGQFKQFCRRWLERFDADLPSQQDRQAEDQRKEEMI